MIKNYIKKGTVALVLSVLAIGCSKDAMDKVNKDRNNPNEVPAKFVITDAIVSSAFNITGSDYAFYASVYMEHHVGIYGQLYNAEKRIADPYLSSTYDNSWSSSYTNLWNLKGVIESCSPGGKEAGNFQTLGIAQVLTAYNLAILTDLMGDVPWTEAGQPGVIFQPKLDKQEAIYKNVFEFLDAAIVNLDKTSSFASIGAADLLFKGNSALWKKFAYGLRARYNMRLSLKAPKYQQVIDDVNKSFISPAGLPAEEAKFAFNGGTLINPFYKFGSDRDYFGASTSLHNKLVARNDPRDANFFVPYKEGGPLVFAPNGNPDQTQELYGLSGLLSPTAPIYMLSYHELQFLKAEAYARLTNLTLAEEALKLGIEHAFLKVGLTRAQAQTYYTANVKALFTVNPLKEIMIQKYIAFFEDEAVEAYSDFRRSRAMGNNYAELANSSPIPLRYTYGSSDVTTNNNVKSAYGDGQYVKTENVWWAGGTR